ncbi:hypothetical protein Hanom_Chr13g01235221 [Helianthus anomalus]
MEVSGELTSSLTSSSSSTDEVFNVYFKGLVCGETVSIRICDTSYRCLYELRLSSLFDAGDLMELQALMEVLNVAVNLGLKRVAIFCRSNLVYQYVSSYVNDHHLFITCN